MFDIDVQEKSSGAAESLTEQETQLMRIRWQGDDRFHIQVRGHTITVDQPVEGGGTDAGATPTELFVAGLASCVAFYARRYLRRHHIDATGLEVTTAYEMGTKPTRVAGVAMEIHVPAQISSERRAGLLAQAKHCTVHNSIAHTPHIAITLTPAS